MCTAYTPAEFFGGGANVVGVMGGGERQKIYTGGSHRLAKYVRQYKFMLFQNINNL